MSILAAVQPCELRQYAKDVSTSTVPAKLEIASVRLVYCFSIDDTWIQLGSEFDDSELLLALFWCCVSLPSCSSLVHSFKHAFRPAVRHVAGSSSIPSAGPATPTTHITLHLSQLLAGASDPMEVDEPAPCAWPPVGTHLGHLPSHLVRRFNKCSLWVGMLCNSAKSAGILASHCSWSCITEHRQLCRHRSMFE